MPERSQLPEAKRTLLDKYVRGMLPKNTTLARAIPRRTPGTLVPLSSEQQDLWRLARAVPNMPVYTECVTLHLPGPLDVAALERSFGDIICRHEAWRTSFPVEDGEPVQRIHPSTTVRLPLVDLRRLPAPAREVEAIRLAEADARDSFDLANGPLLRTRLVRFSETDHRLFLTLHYIIFDGVTLYQILLPELRTLYETISASRSSPSTPLPELPIQYADYALWQREWLRGEVLSQQLAYWNRQLVGTPSPLTLPSDYPRPAIRSYRGAMHPFALSRDLTEALKALSRQAGVTLFMAMFAAFSMLLHCYTGQGDILIGTKTAGRMRAEVRGLMGYFLHVLPLRINLADNPTCRELLRRARDVTIGAVAHEDVPLEQVLEMLRTEHDASQMALLPVMLAVEPPLPRFSSGWTISQMDVDTHTCKCDLYLELDERPEGIVGRFEYSTDLFKAETIARMSAHWRTVLEEIVAAPGRRVFELPLLSAIEQHWSPTGRLPARLSANRGNL